MTTDASQRTTAQTEELVTAAKGILPEAQAWFRHLHEHPELSYKEFETTKFITNVLSELDNIEILQPCETGVIGVLKGAHEGPIIALRADIDALNLQEETDVPYKSVNNEVMHACGHDVHTTNLLAAAKILNDYQDKLHGTVYFVFQAAEEKQPGGAIDIVNSGVLDGVKYSFAHHLIPNLPTGTVAFKSDTLLGASDRFYLTVKGKGGHASAPHLAVDPVVVTAEIIQALQTVVSRKTDPAKSPIISVTMVNTAPGADNIIPESVKLSASVRNFDNDIRHEAITWIKQLVEGIAVAHGATVEFDYHFGYDPLINDDAPNEISIKAAESFLDDEHIIILDQPMPAGEDFGRFGKVSEISYYVVGCGNPDKGTTVSPHSPRYKADDAAIYYGTMMHLAIIDELLMSN